MVTPAQINQLSTPAKVPGESASKPATVQGSTYAFLAGWVLLIVILMFVNRSRLGHVIIYYSLLLIILFILVTEYQQIAPLIGGIETIGQLKQ